MRRWGQQTVPRVIFTYKTAAVAEMVRGLATSDQDFLSERANPPPPCTAGPRRLAHQAPTLFRECGAAKTRLMAGFFFARRKVLSRVWVGDVPRGYGDQAAVEQPATDAYQ